MALFIEQTLYNNTVVRYHRISEYRINLSTFDSVVVLDSSPEELQAPTISREFAFVRSGNPETMPAEAYAAIKALPEWAGAIDV